MNDSNEDPEIPISDLNSWIADGKTEAAGRFREASKAIRGMYISLIESGFTEDESLRIVMSMVNKTTPPGGSS